LKKILAISSLLCFIIIGAGFIALSKPRKLKFPVPKGWAKPVYDFKSNPITQEGFELGRRIFYDERISKDSSISCASCHQQFAAFTTFDHNLSHGFNNSLTTRNAPSLQNLAWQKDFMADGGIVHLDLQPLAPMTAHNEMGETIEGIIKKLNGDTSYKRMFNAAFGSEEINTQRMNRAISQFVLMMVSSNSKYDKVMRKQDTFNLPQSLGYDIFKKKCASCHKEPMFTDYSFRNNGMALEKTLNDYGRMKISQHINDSLKFRVPSLRNVAVTAPYGHDGRFFSLSNVFEHYRKNMKVGPTTDSLLKNKLPLSNFEIGQLTAFLYTLTDTSFLKNPMFAPPGYNITPTFIHNH
jgi:cytochrome c peroxidase